MVYFSLVYFLPEIKHTNAGIQKKRLPEFFVNISLKRRNKRQMYWRNTGNIRSQRTA